MRGINKISNSIKALRSETSNIIGLNKQTSDVLETTALNSRVEKTIPYLKQLKNEFKNIGDTESIQRINEYMQQLYSSVPAVQQLFQSFTGLKEPISDTEILTNKLKEVESQLRACGETAKANKIKEMLQKVSKETTDVKGSMEELRQYIEKTFGTDVLKQFDQELKNIDKTTKNVGKKNSFASSLKTALGIGTVALGIRKAVSFLKSSTTESVDFVETQNLFNVSMGKTVDQYGNLDREASKYYTKAIAFQEKLEEKLGINIAESMQYQALFNAMSKSMGISAKHAYTLSENFTKLGYDLSSLYNIDPENAMQKLRAGLSGQTKPLRDLGLDITSQSLEPLLDELGIERSVKQLSQAEKMVARYIVVLRQASLAHGDFAKTMDSPANQLRIFNAQLTAFKRNMGNLWQGMLGGILPYINAIMMVINELLKMVAKLFGFEVAEQNISAGIGADDLADDLGTATDEAKKLKNQLMGFDEINNITLQKDKDSGASVGGIDKRLLDAMKEYDNMMNKVKSKATAIKNQIMKWLGFTGDTNKDMKILKGWLDKIKSVAKVILALYIGSKLLKLIGYIRTLKGVLTGTKAPMTSFQNGLALVGKGFKGTINWVKDGIKSFKSYYSETGKVVTALNKTSKSMFDAIPNAVKLAGGIAGLVGSSVLAYKSMEDLSKGTISTQEAMLKLTGSIAGATVSGALIGSVFGPAGTAIGAVAGFTISATSALLGYKTEADEAIVKSKEMKANIEKEAQAWQELKQGIQEQADAQLSEMSYIGLLTDELKKLTNENGNVKRGYEDRVNFILSEVNKAFGTEYSLVNGQIVKNGELKTSISEVTSEIYKQIEAKKGQILLEANEKLYTEAIQNKTNAYISYTEALQAQKQAQEDYNNALEEQAYWENYYDQQAPTTVINRINATNAVCKYKEALDNQNSALKIAEETYTGYSETVIKYENLSTAMLTGSTEEKIQAIEKYTNTIQTETGKRSMTLTEELEMTTKDLGIMKKIYSDTGKEITKEEEATMNNRIKIVADKLLEQTNKVEKLTPEQKKAWQKLASGNYDIYKEYLEKTSPKVREEIQNMTGVIIEKTPEVEKVIQELSDSIVDNLDNSSETRQKAIEAVKEYMNGLSDEQQRRLLKDCGTQNADKVIEGLKQGNLSEDVGVNIIKGLRTGLQNNYWQGRTLSTAFNFATNILNKFKRTFGIQSPSKKTRQFGMYLLEGLGLGIKKEENGVLKTVGNFSNKVLDNFGLATNSISQGIKVNPNDFNIDTNQFIDYGQISGVIATQSNVNVSSDIEGRIENAIYRGLSNATIPVEIEATTDEGVIFKKVQTKAREFSMQTGEPAFDF